MINNKVFLSSCRVCRVLVSSIRSDFNCTDWCVNHLLMLTTNRWLTLANPFFWRETFARVCELCKIIELFSHVFGISPCYLLKCFRMVFKLSSNALWPSWRQQLWCVRWPRLGRIYCKHQRWILNSWVSTSLTRGSY